MRKNYTTFEIGRICQVYPTTVINWIKEGKLASFTTPGGHRRVRPEDLADFLRRYNFPMPEELMRNGRPKILIVDDDPEMVRLVSMTLESEARAHGWDVQSVSTGFGAGVKIFEWQPDLILLDFLMPDLDGDEVCRALRENQKSRLTPIIALTCLTSEKDRARIFESGATDYIAKPFERAKLIEKVKKHLTPNRRGLVRESL
ncbi:MAG: response regulator [Candidatus Omnitrophica bacterium]|nr:response regulator [Candidatus Omnitrophota bacterium]